MKNSLRFLVRMLIPVGVTTVLWLVPAMLHGQAMDKEFARFPANDTNFAAPLEHPRNALSGFVQLGPVFQSANFKGLPDAPSCCPGYGSTAGFSVGFGTGIKHYINQDWTIGTQLGLDINGGTFHATEATTIIVGGNPTDAQFAHDISMSITQLSVVNDIAYSVYAPFYGFAGLGFHVLMGSSMEQSETLVNPSSTGTFTGNNSTRVRNRFDAPMRSVQDIMLSGRIGVGGIYWLGNATEYAIEGRLWYQLYFGSPINRVDDWTMHSLRVGVSFFYTLDTTTFR